VEIGTSVDASGKVWVRLVFHEMDGTERAYAYDADVAAGISVRLDTAVQIAEQSNPSN
jgi:hypothetical protein